LEGFVSFAVVAGVYYYRIYEPRSSTRSTDTMRSPASTAGVGDGLLGATEIVLSVPQRTGMLKAVKAVTT
jgi:hypothetical protein